ncbi:Hypothetical predicted protein [Mytilus galloprovincialis]|uniref:Mab-21-like nucleotidyltransferase domain-containing protein n=1 Tax=Mytilus galloprovincialis TaxID=29158 RepID=A0A8B6EFI9_MYTGA|nr:Hypothetical predicted protein [Mytilus galloprovincialis]
MSQHINELQQMNKTLNYDEVEKVNKYLCDLHDRELVFSRSEAEIEDIKIAVEDMVEKVISKFGEYGDRRMYEVSQKYLVGSMAEETRIKEPSEFDFLVVLKNLSVPGALEIVFIDNDKDCQNYYRWDVHTFKHAHLRIKDPNLRETFGKEYTVNDDGVLDKVFLKYMYEMDVINTAIRKIAGKAIDKDTGKLSFSDYQTRHNGAALTLQMEWTPKSTQKLRICIDIVFAIQIFHHMVRKEDSNVPQYFDQLKEDNSCFVLPTTDEFNGQPCFKFTFTLTEVKLTKSLSMHHKTCYRLIKYIVQQCGEVVSRAFPSYLIKTVLLRHSLQCLEMKNFLVCIIDIIEKMSSTCSHGNFAHMAEKMLFLKENCVTYDHGDVKQYLHMFGCLTEIITELVSKARV